MTTVALVVAGLGGLLMSGAVIFVLLAFSELRELRILGSRLPSRVGTRGRVALSGFTEHGPAGPQRAPVSGEDCAWYRVRLVRTPRRFFARDDIGSDAEADFDLLLSVASPDAPTLTDGANASRSTCACWVSARACGIPTNPSPGSRS